MRVFYLYWALFYDSKFTETTNTNRKMFDILRSSDYIQRPWSLDTEKGNMLKLLTS